MSVSPNLGVADEHLEEFADVFSDVYGYYTTLEHITFITTDRVQAKGLFSPH